VDANFSSRPPLAAAIVLLESAGLPVADLTEQRLEHFLFCGSPDRLTGLVGLELYGADALLRSLAVAPSARGVGLGTALVQHAESYARGRGVHTLYLLTTTAKRFFEARGYRLTARAACPKAIQATAEFASLCPVDAALLTKRL
jgi:amino-acid N-acetyltransferase